MATLATLTTALFGTGAGGVIKDSSYYAAATTWINDAVTAIAGGIRLADGRVSPPLPDLFTEGTVATATDAAYKAMPSDYQRALFMVVDEDGNHVPPPRGGDYYSFVLFNRRANKLLLNETGSVYMACLKGSNLYYQGIPSTSKDLTVRYYKTPTALSEDSDEPDCIPAHLQTRLIKHWVAKEIYGEIEDGEDGKTPNVDYHTRKFQEALRDLADHVGIDAEPEYYGAEDYDYGGDYYE
jgi:hypothetical protein